MDRTGGEQTDDEGRQWRDWVFSSDHEPAQLRKNIQVWGVIKRQQRRFMAKQQEAKIGEARASEEAGDHVWREFLAWLREESGTAFQEFGLGAQE